MCYGVLNMQGAVLPARLQKPTVMAGVTEQYTQRLKSPSEGEACWL